jgi:hypothetical protein
MDPMMMPPGLPLLGPNGQPLPGGPQLGPPGMGPPPGMMPPGAPPMMTNAPMGMPPIDPMLGGPMPGPPPVPISPMGSQTPISLPPMPPQMEYDQEYDEDIPPGPIYPEWQIGVDGNNILSKKKPKKSYIDAAINADQMNAGRLVLRFLEDIRLYRMMQSSVFEDLNSPDLEAGQIADIPIVINKIANMIHAIQPNFEWCYNNDEELKESQLLEDWCHWAIKQLAIHHSWSGSALLQWDWSWYHLLYGRIVSRVLPDVTDPEFPWNYTLFDPATVFPTFGNKRGLTRVTCVYRQSVDVMLQEYGDNKKFANKVLSKVGDDKGYADFNDVREVREYYDQWYRYVEFDGIEALPITAHELGYVPFVYTVGPGEAGSAAAPTRTNLTRREIEAGIITDGTSTDQDMDQKGVAFFHHAKPTIRQLEMTISLAMTTAKQRINPPIAIESPYDDTPKPISMQTGATNKLRLGEKVVPLLNGVQPADLVVLLDKFTKDLDRLMLPDQIFGRLDASNISGFAANSMTAAAKDQILPQVAGVRQHMEDVLDMMLRQYRDFGYAVTDNAFPVETYGRFLDGNRGVSPGRPQMELMTQMLQQLAPQDPTGMSAAWNVGALEQSLPQSQAEPRVITRELIVRMGSRPTVRLESLALMDKLQMMQYTTGMNQAKLMSRFTAMSENGIPNPPREWKRILREDAETNPKMLELIEYPQAIWESGNEAAFFAYFATILWPAMMQAMMGMMAPPGQEGAPGGGPPGASSPDQPLQGTGNSQAAVGHGPGPGSGPTGQLGPDPNAGGGI